MSASNAGRVAIIGASGSGKSSYAKRFIHTAKRTVIFDPMDEYYAQGAARCTTIEQVQSAMRASFSGFRLAFVPKPGHEATGLNRLSHLCLKAQEPFKGKRAGPALNIVVEEMNTCFPLHGAEGRAPAFAEICSRGRHSFINVIGISQRFAEVSMRFRGNLTECVAFRCNASDVKAAADATNAPANDIRALKDLHYIRSVQGDITRGEIKF